MADSEKVGGLSLDLQVPADVTPQGKSRAVEDWFMQPYVNSLLAEHGLPDPSTMTPKQAKAIRALATLFRNVDPSQALKRRSRQLNELFGTGYGRETWAAIGNTLFGFLYAEDPVLDENVRDLREFEGSREGDLWERV